MEIILYSFIEEVGWEGGALATLTKNKKDLIL